MNYETLDNVVSQFLMEAGFGEAEYARAYHIALRGMHELSIDLPLQEVQTTKLYIEQNGLGVLPEDCLKVLSISRKIGDGMVALTRERDIAKLGTPCESQSHKCHECHNYEGGCICKKYNVSNPRVYNTSPYWDGGSYGVGSWKDYGKYYITGHTVYLSPSLSHCDDIYIEYKAFPKEMETGEPYVHPYVREALIAYVRWIFAINRKNQDKWDKQYYEAQWKELRRNARYRLKSPMKQELNQSARRHTKFGLKS